MIHSVRRVLAPKLTLLDCCCRQLNSTECTPCNITRCAQPKLYLITPFQSLLFCTHWAKEIHTWRFLQQKKFYVRSLKTMMHCTKNNQNPFEKNQKRSWRNVLQNFSYSLNKFRIIKSLKSSTHECTYLWVDRDLGNWWKEPWLVFLGHIVSSNKAWVVRVSLILGL